MTFLFSPSLLPFIPNTMREEQVFAEEVLGKVVKLDIVCAQTVGGSNATHTCEFMHILRYVHSVTVRNECLIVCLPPVSMTQQTRYDFFH